MKWLLQIHSENGNLSSKRFYGGLMLITCIVAVYTKTEHTILEPMLYTGAGLIGFGTTVKIAQALKSGKVEAKAEVTPVTPVTNKEPEAVG